MTDLVEKIRAEIQALKFEPLDDNALEDMQKGVAVAVNNNAIEGQILTDEEVAIDEMLINERAPTQVRLYAKRRLIEERVFDGQSLKGSMFPECEY